MTPWWPFWLKSGSGHQGVVLFSFRIMRFHVAWTFSYYTWWCASTLWLGGRSLAGLHSDCGGLWRRSSTTCCGTSCSVPTLRYGRNVARRSAAHGDASEPTRDGLSGCASNDASSDWRNNGKLGRCGPMARGGFELNEITYDRRRHRYYREEAEVRADSGPTGRRGVPMRSGGLQGEVLREIFPDHGWTSLGRRGPHVGTAVRSVKEGEGTQAGALCGLRCMGAIPKEDLEGQQIHHLRDVGRWHLRVKAGARTFMLQPLGGILQSDEDSIHHAGFGISQRSGQVGGTYGEASPKVSKLLALTRGGGEQSSAGTLGEDPGEVEAPDRYGREAPLRLGQGGAVEHHMAYGVGRWRILAGAIPHTSTELDGKGLQRHSEDSCRGDSSKCPEWRSFEATPCGRWRQRGFVSSEVRKQGEERSKEEEMAGREGRAEATQTERKWKGWRRPKPRGKVIWFRGRRVFCLEQRKRCLQRSSPRRTLQRKEGENPQMHPVQKPGTPIERLPEQEEVRSNLIPWIAVWGDSRSSRGEGKDPSNEGQGSNEEIKDKDTKVRKKMSEGDEKIEGDKVEIDGEMLTEEEYLKSRIFTFVHHFSGPIDNLGRAVEEEAAILGLTVHVTSADIEKGEDLAKSEPYVHHLASAKRGEVDGYHSGFPCNSFTVLRWRESPGMPPPVRSAAAPYGFPNQSKERQAEADKGTVLMSRSLGMAVAIMEAEENKVIPGFVTLENPPPSGKTDHVSAWEMPETQAMLEKFPKFNRVEFDTCAFQPEVELGHRNKKPQMFGGTLRNLTALRKMCPCEGAPHSHVVGKEKSRASGTYPAALCRLYGKLAAQHFLLMGKAEFLDAKHRNLKRVIRKQRDRAEELWKDYGKTTPVTPPRRAPPSSPQGAPRKKRRMEEEEDEAPGSSSGLVWTGGRGKHGMIKESKARRDLPQNLAFVGGMRNPARAVESLPTVQSIGQRIHQRWEDFVMEYPEVLKTAESYGTAKCKVEVRAVEAWAETLKEMFGPPETKRKERDPMDYHTPMDTELVSSWVEASGDPETEVPKWLVEGAPLGIEPPIVKCGIFPPAEENKGGGDPGEAITQGELEKKGFKNYLSVEANKADAEIELSRYEKLGFLQRLPKEQTLKDLEGGTISRLGLVVKEKPDNTKKLRIVIDLKRSGGNAKSELPERLVLPRPLDAVQSLRDLRRRRLEAGQKDSEAEFALIDISDAFTTLPLHEKELKHSLSPSTREGEILQFRALLFGYRTAPLLYSRLAAMMSRLLQAIVDPLCASHQTYLDDALWMLMGSLSERTFNLAAVIYTLLAFKMKIAMGKGERAGHVTWVGVRFSLVERDTVVLGLPAKFLNELLTMLRSWKGVGMAPNRELRQLAGKASWLAGILPRAKWTVSILYGVLKQVEADEQEGKEESRRRARADNRSKKGLFAVKRIGAARQWLEDFVEAATQRPMRKLNIKPKAEAEVRLMVDASPYALGGVLAINERLVACFSSKVGKEDEEVLGITRGEAAGQGILEALALLVALKHWANRMMGYKVRVVFQSDSVVALALSQKLSASTATLNFLGAEIALCLEEGDVEKLEGIHIPGVANTEPDWLSRPEKWSKVAKPPLLQDLKVEVPLSRPAEYYHLPSPTKDPTMWGAGSDSVVGTGAWDSIR